jgi:rod shape-determining protein MreD
VPDLLRVILVAVLWDVLLTPFVLPLVMRMFERLEPARTA